MLRPVLCKARHIGCDVSCNPWLSSTAYGFQPPCLRMWGLDCQKPCSTAIFESSNNWWLCLTVFGPCCLVCHLQLPPSSSSTCAPQWWVTWRHSVLNPTPGCPVNRCRSCHSELQLVSARQQLAAFLQRVRWMPGCMWINKPTHVPRKQVGYEGNTSDVSAQPASSQDCEPSKGDPCTADAACKWPGCTAQLHPCTT